jgi:hypothetical protein
MPPTSRQLKGLIEDIQKVDLLLDNVDHAVLHRWENDDQALDALRDILASGETIQGPTNALEIAAFIKLVLKIKRYAERTDRDSAVLAKLDREKKRVLAGTWKSLSRTFAKKKRIPPMAVAKILADLYEGENATSPQLPVRSNSKGSRIRTLFLRELSLAVHDDVGVGWMDTEVAAIASMVLEYEIDAEHVRNARRS